jgi:hypothetical protein
MRHLAIIYIVILQPPQHLLPLHHGQICLRGRVEAVVEARRHAHAHAVSTICCLRSSIQDDGLLRRELFLQQTTLVKCR